jgi:hypothetical protein
MITSVTNLKKLFRQAHFLRVCEILIFVPLVIYGFLLSYNQLICIPQQSCNIPFVSASYTILLIQLGLIVNPVVSTILILYNFIIFDEDPRTDKFFKIAIGLLSLSYCFLGWLLPEILKSGSLQSNLTVYVFLIIIYFISLILLMRNSYSWENSSLFIKTRICILVIGYALILIEPIVGLVFLFLSISPMLLIPFDPRVLEKSFK